MGGSYALLASVRRKELPTRLVLAVVLTAAAYVVAPSVWPLVWFGLVGITQAIDWRVNQAIRAEPSRRALAGWAVSTFLASAVYTALSLYVWTYGAEPGRVLAILLAAGSLLHVAIHMHHVRGLFLAAAAPHALVFFGLPLSAALAGDVRMWPIVLGAALYAAHLFAGFRQFRATTAMLQDERNRAEQASKAKSDFLAVMSHEIRTPMNAIVSAANLLSNSELDDQQREQVEILTDANDVLLSLLNDVLDLSKIEAGKMTVDYADLELPRLLHGLQRLWEARATFKGLELYLEISPDVPQMVRADPLRLKQILFNLISNAVKFTAEGAVTVRLTGGERHGRETLEFEVIDTGDGIPPEVLQRLFGAFEQGDAGTTRAHGGSGLGLAISRRLAHLLEGSLEVESEVGRGSIFRLVLPLLHSAAEADVADDAADAAAVTLEDLRVLVAEDHPVNQRVLELLLEPMGCDLSFADDGAKAVELAGVQEFDAILMDMQMPVLDGIEATRRIRAGDGVNVATPVIALTANALDHHRAAWAEVGVTSFVPKPIDPRLLVSALSAAATQAAAKKAA